jgi:hypothetical protein
MDKMKPERIWIRSVRKRPLMPNILKITNSGKNNPQPVIKIMGMRTYITEIYVKCCNGLNFLFGETGNGAFAPLKIPEV